MSAWARMKSRGDMAEREKLETEDRVRNGGQESGVRGQEVGAWVRGQT